MNQADAVIALPPRPARTARSIANEIVESHGHLIDTLKALPPNVIHPFCTADAADLRERAEILQRTMRAMERYVAAFMVDTAANSWAVDLDRKWMDGLFDDLIGDCCGKIENAAERAREVA